MFEKTWFVKSKLKKPNFIYGLGFFLYRIYIFNYYFRMGNNEQNKYCDFCDKEIDCVQEVIRNDKIKVIYPHKPVIEEHVMLTPVRHTERFDELKEDEVIELANAVKKINKTFAGLYGTSAFNLFVNDGKKAGQHVPHVHFHFFGRSEQEKISPYKILNNPGLYKTEKLPNKEIRDRVDKIREELIKFW